MSNPLFGPYLQVFHSNMWATSCYPSGKSGLNERIDRFKKRLIAEAMVESKGNQAKAARALGLTYHQFRYYHRKHVRRGQ